MDSIQNSDDQQIDTQTQNSKMTIIVSFMILAVLCWMSYNIFFKKSSTDPVTSSTIPVTIKITLRGGKNTVRYAIEDLDGNVIVKETAATTSWKDISFDTNKSSIIIKRTDRTPNTLLEIKSIMKNKQPLPMTIAKSSIRGDLIFFPEHNKEGEMARQNSIKMGKLAWGPNSKGIGGKYQIDLN